MWYIPVLSGASGNGTVSEVSIKVEGAGCGSGSCIKLSWFCYHTCKNKKIQHLTGTKIRI